MTFHPRLQHVLAGSGIFAALWLSLNVTAAQVGRPFSARSEARIEARERSIPAEKPRMKSQPFPAEFIDVAGPIDAAATAETRRLHVHLAMLAYREGFAFGMQGDHHGGVGWDDKPDGNGVVPDSDLFKVAGVDAGVSGYNVNWLFDAANNADPKGIQMLGEEMRAAHARGEIITIHWPMTNPETGSRLNRP